jgi:hypothetical protein
MKKQSTLFDVKDLIPIQDLCADGTIPFHHKSAERLCRVGALPAVKVGIRWCTTKNAAREYFWKHANMAFKKTHV